MDASAFCWVVAFSFVSGRIEYRSLYPQCPLNSCALSCFILALAKHHARKMSRCEIRYGKHALMMSLVVA